METLNSSIQDKINNSALIVRKYNLGDENYFFSQFRTVDKVLLRLAWTTAQKEVQNKEIIKEGSNLSSDDFQKAARKASTIEDNEKALFYYLNSKFDVTELKLTDEKIERRVRKLIADRYLLIVTKEVSDFIIEKESSLKYKVKSFFTNYKTALIVYPIVAILLFSPKIIDKFTPVEVLTEKIHDRSKYKFRVGATCNDGTSSTATGSGACSHHGGVDKWKTEIGYKKTLEECRKEAEEISWRD